MILLLDGIRYTCLSECDDEHSGEQEQQQSDDTHNDEFKPPHCRVFEHPVHLVQDTSQLFMQLVLDILGVLNYFLPLV